MKRCVFVVVLLAGFLAALSLGAQETDQSTYHLVVIDRAKCPGASVQINEPLAVISHGKTGYHIVFGRGPVTIPADAEVMVDLSSKNPSVIYGYLSDPSFHRYVSSPKVLEGLKFTVAEVNK